MRIVAGGNQMIDLIIYIEIALVVVFLLAQKLYKD